MLCFRLAQPLTQPILNPANFARGAIQCLHIPRLISETSSWSATAAAGKPPWSMPCSCASGTIKHKASVLDGSSASDFEKEEKEHGHSIYSAILHCDHLGKRINIIDTPGSPDLIGYGIAALPAVETVAVVINAQSGIEVVTRRMMEIARSRDLPRAIIINKIDLPGNRAGRPGRADSGNLRPRMPADQSAHRQVARPWWNACSTTAAKATSFRPRRPYRHPRSDRRTRRQR